MQPGSKGEQDAGEELGVPLGTVLDERYRILEILGEGGVGIVYLAQHIAVGKQVAVKVLQRRYTHHALLRPRFELEARALAALSHPNIVAISDYGMVDGNPYVVMELLEGQTLREAIDEGDGLTPERALNIFTQLLRGLAYAHSHGLVHRDIKPGNIFVRPLPHQPEQVKILDFGFAKFLEGWDRDANEQVSQVGQSFGTPSYLPPEQATGAHTDARTDVYASAVILFEMLTREKPFTGDLPEIVRQHLSTPVRHLRELVPELPAIQEFDELIQRGMSKRPRDRYADAEDMLQAVEQIQLTGRRRKKRRSPFLKVTAAAVALAIGTGAGWVATRDDPSRELEARWAEVIALFESEETAAVLPVDEAQPFAAQTEESGAVDEGSDGEGGMVLSPEELEDVAPVGDGSSIWDRDPTPEVVTEARTQIEAGEDITQSAVRALHELGQQNPSDPRPDLLLGRTYFARGWWSDALRRYESAFEGDPSVRADPLMLDHLIEICRTSSLDMHAEEVIVEIYGENALPRVEAALARDGLDRTSVERLRHLQRAIDPSAG